MKCTDFKEQAEMILDDEISPAIKRRFNIHLQECELCRLNFEDLHAVRKALKINLPAAPSRKFDERMMKAFSERQKQTSKDKYSDWRGTFVPLFTPQTVWAFSAAVFVLGVFAAFQIGKMAATDIHVNSAPIDAVSLPLPEIKEENPPAAPITKIVEVPVIKERVVTRVVYVEHEKQNRFRAKVINPKLPGNAGALNNSIAKNGYLTETNLKGFQPASETTATVIKGERSDKK